MSEEKGVVKYQARDGQEVTLSFQNVKQYLVSGNKEAVTNQELMYFLGICKSRGLNPFKKDAYLIKYGNDPAAIITSIDYFRSRAKAQPDCVGWKKGIIIQNGDGTLKDSAGIILDGETLVGGFFEAQPEGWKTPFRLEVNLKGYIKKTKEGRTTRFWEADNQPTMISKVAEGQGLRSLWPDEFQGIYEEAEIKAPTIDMSQIKNGSFEKADPVDTTRFDQIKNGLPEDPYFSEIAGLLDKYIALSARANGKTEDEIKVMFTDDLADSLKNFKKWAEKEKPLAAPEKSSAEKTVSSEKNESSDAAAETSKAATSEQGPQPSAWDPYSAEVQLRYGKDKIEILKAELDKKGRIYTTTATGKELHLLLLPADAITEAPSGDLDPSSTQSSSTSNHKNILDERAAKRKAMYGEKPREDHEIIKTNGDNWSEDDPQKIAGDPPGSAAEKEELRQVCIDDLKKIGLADRSIWMKSKQQVGLISPPNLATMPIEKLVEWSTLARKMVENEKDIKF